MVLLLHLITLVSSSQNAGHAMYEQNLGDSDLGLDSALSMGVHESQSLFWERHVGLSRPFYKWARPILTEAFGKDDKFNYSAEEIYDAVNGVDFENNLIRVEADELNYPLHVILRYNIERAVVAGDLDVNDIPAQWNKSMKEFFAIDVPNDTKGCLQDIHWSCLVRRSPVYLMLFHLSETYTFFITNFTGHWLLSNLLTWIHDGGTTCTLL
jgi:Zn-dependent M32 family carboxypeptidase